MVTIPKGQQVVPAPGYVVLEIPYLVREEKNGVILNTVSTETIGDYTVRSGVVAVTGTTEAPGLNMLYSSPLQVSVGDKVWFHPNALQQIATDDIQRYRLVRQGERLLVSIPYAFLVMKLERGSYVGLNDYVISELEDESGTFHRVIATPLPGTFYRGPVKETNVDVKIGQKVALRLAKKLYIEHERDTELPGRWCCFQSKYVLAGDDSKEAA